MNELVTFYNFTIETVREAGRLALVRQREVFTVGNKNQNPKDIVTSVDREVGAFITGAICERFPEHAIWNEEAAEIAGNEYEWTIDPIDGTANFARGIPHFSVVLGLSRGGVPLCGAVFDPSTDELFSFRAGEGAFFNGAVMMVSPIVTLAESTILFAGGRREDLAVWAGESYTKLLLSAQKTKNLGSSALDICYVAAGRAEAYVAGTLSTKDVAAALGILVAAGGVATDALGNHLTTSPMPQKSFIANATVLADELRTLLLT